ncbi:glyoxalase [Luteimicrobium album]|uniref:Glyoxalase n=1 Tax=Luteimicrobium album TaxID=1054550 RepID=A0ABQ6HWR7_9MICO|nr:VOC family protein [Luteimicrobium album]GMA22582.1 glyoxalase [Luteimicrobium album]
MTSFVAHTTVDCRDAYALSEWWKQVLGYVDLDGDPNAPGHEECLVLDPDTGHRLLFVEVPEPKSVKNRLHLDLRPREGTRDQEVERLLGIGATLVADRREPATGLGWAILGDPEGNEFCVLRSEAELADA